MPQGSWLSGSALSLQLSCPAVIDYIFMQAAKVRTNQFLFLNAPSLAYFDWHPFSVAAAYPSADGLTQDVIIHIKAYGSWSQVGDPVYV